MPKGDDGMLDKLDGRVERVEGGGFESRVERVEILHWINRIFRIRHRDCSRNHLRRGYGGQGERKGRKDLNH